MPELQERHAGQLPSYPRPNSHLERIVNAVLYEGYILYPYRASSKKNQQRFTFGRVYPQKYSEAQSGLEPCVMQTECLARVSAENDATLKVSVGFLQPMAREIGKVGKEKSPFQIIPELSVDGQLFQTWLEAVERKVNIASVSIGAGPVQANYPFSFPEFEDTELLCENNGRVAGKLRRRQEAIEGVVELGVQRVEENLLKITVRIVNLTTMLPDESDNQETVLMRTLASAHAVLRMEGGEFISLTDPPPECRSVAEDCENIGTWPVLVGDEERGELQTLLSSPIILPDYPKVAPESAGDLFDATEIDEILTLRIQTMTEQEKLEMRMVDEHARRLLERTESATAEDMFKLHGTMRDAGSFDDQIFGNSKRLEGVVVRRKISSARRPRPHLSERPRRCDGHRAGGPNGNHRSIGTGCGGTRPTGPRIAERSGQGPRPVAPAWTPVFLRAG